MLQNNVPNHGHKTQSQTKDYSLSPLALTIWLSNYYYIFMRPVSKMCHTSDAKFERVSSKSDAFSTPVYHIYGI